MHAQERYLSMNLMAMILKKLIKNTKIALWKALKTLGSSELKPRNWKMSFMVYSRNE